jgi:hypothetical protein
LRKQFFTRMSRKNPAFQCILIDQHEIIASDSNYY